MLCKESYHISCSFNKGSSGISLLQLSVSSLLENSLSKGEILDNKNVYEIINQSKFFYNTEKAALFKTNGFANICICIF